MIDPVGVADLGFQGRDVGGAPADVGGRFAGVTFLRIRKAGGDQAGLAACQLGGGRSEMMLRGSLDPEYSLAHLGDIQVNLHNSFLAPKELDQNREISLEAFAHHRPVRKQEHILRRLLGDSASTPATLAAFIFLLRLLYRLPVEAAVLVKKVVLTGYHGAGHLGRDPLVRHPSLMNMIVLVSAVLYRPLDHQRGDIDRTPSQDQDPQEGHGNEGQRQLDKKKPPESSQ